MTLRDATPDEIQRFDDLIWATPGGPDPMQLLPYGQVKRASWQARPMVHEHDGHEPLACLYLVKKVPPFGQLWYAPMGPRVVDADRLRLCCDDLRRSGAFAVILEPSIPAHGPDDKARVIAQIPGMADHLTLQQGQSTVFIDLSGDEESILASFRQRARRAIRKADDARIEHRTDDEAFELFWPLYEETVQRAGLPLRPKQYYVDAWRLYRDLGQGHVVLAWAADGGDRPVAGAYLWHLRDLGYYRDGGSVRTPAANGIQYRVQWECMRWAKEHGATRYDLYGAPPSWAADDEQHQLHGLVQFKTAFGDITDCVGTMRLVVNPARTKAWDRLGMRIYSRLSRRRNPLFY